MKRSEVKTGKRLSDTALFSLEPDDKEYRLLDGDNLYFRVKPNGTKSWQLRYKNEENKWAWRGLGAYPSVSGAMARKKAQEIQKALSNGESVLTQKEQRIAELEAIHSTFEQVANEWLDTKQSRWTPDTYVRNSGALKKHIYPVFGKMDYKHIMPKDWFDLLLKIQREQGINEQVKRMGSLCREIYGFARLKGEINFNPLDDVNKYLDPAESKNMKHVAIDELPRLLRAIKTYPTPDICIGLQLLAMLFPRPSELREAKWENVDLEKKVWIKPTTKTGVIHGVPLPHQAIELFRELKTYSGESEYLFPSRLDTNKPKSDAVFIMALRRLGYGHKQNPHGFRHIASTALNNRFADRDQVVEACLAHIKKGVKGVYDKGSHFEERIGMMQWYADYLDELVDDTVIQFKKA